MNTETFHLELITPCFCGGAEPDKQAEIRAPSIRGQLRWWFRTLGGFKSLADQRLNVREQEDLIFGSTAGGDGRAGKLIVRIRHGPAPSQLVKDDTEFRAGITTDRGYLAFPLRSKRDRGTKKVTEYKGRALFDWEDKAGNPLPLPTFTLELLWRGSSALVADIRSLVCVFGHLGSLGFRSRRAFGALAFAENPPNLRAALTNFGVNGNTARQGILIRSIIKRPGELKDSIHRVPNDCIVSLARWLKDWRAHGRTTDHATASSPSPPYNSGFEPYARSDHDRGVDVGQKAGSKGDLAYRPALGLPIVQFFSSGRPQVDWCETFDADKAGRNLKYKGEGRFASPVLLRPHRDAQGKWHALIIFVDAHMWQKGKPVYLSSANNRGQSREVSLDLYEAMKNDPNLASFP